MEKITLLNLEDKAVIIVSHLTTDIEEKPCEIMDIKSIIFMHCLEDMPQPQPKIVNFLE